MNDSKYSEEFKQAAIEKAQKRGKQSLPEFAAKEGVNPHTLKNWLYESKQKIKHHQAALPVGQQAAQWDAAQRLKALNETYGMDPQTLSAWQDQFCKPADTSEHKAALRELQNKYLETQRELNRKEKALAEALLVLQKKFQALLGEQDK